MKRTLILTVVVFCIYIQANYAQSRENEALPIFENNNKTFSSFVGWVKDHSGQWKSAPNKIPGKYWDIDGNTELGEDNISSLNLYSVSYNNCDFILLEVIKKTIAYKYPEIKAGYYIKNRGYYFVFEKENFLMSISPDKMCLNNLNIYSSFSPITILSSNNRASGIVNYLKNSELLLHRITNNYEITYYKTLGIPTYYYKKDNVVRFFINGEISGDLSAFAISKSFDYYNRLQDDYYYECDYNEFVKFFNPREE